LKKEDRCSDVLEGEITTRQLPPSKRKTPKKSKKNNEFGVKQASPRKDQSTEGSVEREVWFPTPVGKKGGSANADKAIREKTILQSSSTKNEVKGRGEESWG